MKKTLLIFIFLMAGIGSKAQKAHKNIALCVGRHTTTLHAINDTTLITVKTINDSLHVDETDLGDAVSVKIKEFAPSIKHPTLYREYNITVLPTRSIPYNEGNWNDAQVTQGLKNYFGW